jgi:TPR repeat protein
MAGRSRAAADAEDHYRRMCKLSRMSEAELRALLASDAETAAPWIESAARYGVAEAQLRLGQLRLDAGDGAAALAWFERAAAQGLAEALNMVGRCWENGWGADVDLADAADWYRRAAEAGSAWGDYNHANMLFDGRGVAEDRAAACAGYRRAASQGHARAMNLLARACEEGWGAARAPAAARDWYRRSAEAGYFRAQYNFAALLAVEGEVEAAAAWFERALSAATPESLGGMAAALARHPEPRLAALAERFRAPAEAA